MKPTPKQKPPETDLAIPKIPGDSSRSIGVDGFYTFVLSNILLVASLGLYWAWLIRVVFQFASQAPYTSSRSDYIAVLGMGLVDDQVQPLYAARLLRAKKLLAEGVAKKVLIIGGKLRNTTISEAEAGKQFLLEKGIGADVIVLEDRSRHTLENLSNVRVQYLSDADVRITLITNRFHLARSHLLAKGFGIKHELCAAEECCKVDLELILRVMKEAYFIHWYQVGKRWSTITRNKKSLSRIQ